MLGVIGDTVIEIGGILFVCGMVKVAGEIEVDVVRRSTILK
jgi:hypothetical protein